MRNTQGTNTAKPCRLSVVADARLVADLRAHQQQVQERTGIRVSLSQVAESLLRRGLGSGAAQT